jgi:hypothetical protein
VNFPPLQLQIFKNGENIVDRESHSWTKNHYKRLFCQGAACSHSYPDLVCVDTAGTNLNASSLKVAIGISQIDGSVLGSATDASYGIVVGTDDTAETWNDYALGAQISHGAGAGQLEYALQNSPGFSGNKTITHSRSFTNNSAGTVTIKEVGLIFYTSVNSFSETNKVLYARDVLGTPVDVDNGEIITVNYIITLGYLG